MQIEKMSPAVKLPILMAVTLLGSFDYKPYSGIIFIGIALLTAQLGTQFKAKGLLQSVKGLVMVAIFYFVFLIGSRGLSGIDLKIEAVSALSLRMVMFSLFAALFVKTTSPRDLVLCLIHFYRVPASVGYAFMTAYRFLPNFQDELELVIHAHRIRGFEPHPNPIVRIWETKRYMIPMLASAIRKGVRLSGAMETRAFQKYDERSYYHEVQCTKKEINVAIMYVLCLGAILVGLSQLGQTHFSMN